MPYRHGFHAFVSTIDTYNTSNLLSEFWAFPGGRGPLTLEPASVREVRQLDVEVQHPEPLGLAAALRAVGQQAVAAVPIRPVSVAM